MLRLNTRRNISLVLFIGLLVVTGVVWSMGSQAEGIKDGVFTGQAKGFGGDVVVDVTISGGKISDIAVRPHQETPFIADPAIETLVNNMLQAQTANVQIVSGATYTSEAMIAAVDQAIKKASTSFEDGVHTGSAEGFGGSLTVEVTVASGSITKVEVTKQSETPYIAGDALEQIPSAIVASQSWNVDIVSGATVTSKAIMAAVESALTN
ncbi:MAG: FMN-binding protein [Firmicutes bacterium]|nr:FMN-binding protein [Bacillota bacterium]